MATNIINANRGQRIGEPSMAFTWLHQVGRKRRLKQRALSFSPSPHSAILLSRLSHSSRLSACISTNCRLHHCRFCLLHQEYGYVGYLLYAAILVGAIIGMRAGIINPSRSIASLHQVIPPMLRKLAILSMSVTIVFMLIAGYAIIFSNLSMAVQ